MEESDSNIYPRPGTIPQQGHQQPCLKFLSRYVRGSVGIKWHYLGIELLDSKDFEELDTIEAEHPVDLNKCCIKMFNLWLRKQPKASWKQLIEALRQPGIELDTLASKIEHMLFPSKRKVPTSHSEVTVLQSDDNQPGQDDKRPQTENNNVTNAVVECAQMKRQFRDVLVTKLRMKYSKVVNRLIQIFREKKVDIEVLITILRFDDVEKNTVFSTDDVFDVVRTEIQLFQHVAKYCKGIYDYRVLHVLIQASECPEAIKELTDFTESLQKSILTEIDLISEHGELLHPDDFMPGTYKFIIEYVGGKCTIETKEMVQGIVEQSVRLKKGTLILKGFGVGSILFIYQISEVVKNYLLQYKFTDQDVTFLEGNSITSLIVDDIRIMSSSQPNKQQLVLKESTTPGDLFSGPVNIKWEAGAPTPMGRDSHTAVWLNGLVYVGGGFWINSNIIDSYNPVSNLWSAPINTPYRYFAMTTLNNKLLIAGGENNSGKITNQILTIDYGQLKNYTKMTMARKHATAAGHHGMLIITGGMDDKYKRFSSTELFDSTNEQWFTCSNLPNPCSSLKSVIVDNIIYLLGVADKDGHCSPAVFTAPLNTLSRHQLKWNNHQDTPWCRSAPVIINGTQLLLVGGGKMIGDKYTYTTDVCKLNKVSHTWEAIGHIPSARDSSAAVSTADNRIIVIGGGQNDEREYTNTVWIGSYEP